jgi:hypothetical protein
MNVKLSKRDDVITIRVGRAVEHVDTFGKDKAQVFDAVRWALISKGASLSEIQITEELQRLHD